MRPKSLALLALALACGLIASIGISQVLDNRNKNVAVETVPIYVALQNINLGDPIDDGMVSLQEWPKDKVPVGAIDTWANIEDRRPRHAIFEGEPILDGKLLVKGHTNDPMNTLPKDMRLKTVSVDARKSAAGLLSPGTGPTCSSLCNATSGWVSPTRLPRLFCRISGSSRSTRPSSVPPTAPRLAQLPKPCRWCSPRSRPTG